MFPPPPPHSPFDRVEDHRWSSDPVCEEAVRRDDSHRVLPQRLRPDRPAALYGQPEAEVCAQAH